VPLGDYWGDAQSGPNQNYIPFTGFQVPNEYDDTNASQCDAISITGKPDAESMTQVISFYSVPNDTIKGIAYCAPGFQTVRRGAAMFRRGRIVISHYVPDKSEWQPMDDAERADTARMLVETVRRSLAHRSYGRGSPETRSRDTIFTPRR
jgi:hypothetical protein